MNLKLILYIFCTMLSAFSLSGINFNNFFKLKRKLEAKIFIIILSLALGYLLTNFIYDFFEVSKIIK